MRVHLLHSYALLGLLVVPYLWQVWLRGLSDFPRWQRRATLAVRSLLVVLIAVALARPQITWRRSAVAVVALVDRSRSMDGVQRAAAESLVEAIRGRAGRGRHVLVRSFATDGLETDLSAAIRLGAVLIPADAAGRLVLISDGNQTRGDALAAAQAAAAAGLRVFTAAPTPGPRREMLVRSIVVPASAAPGATAEVTIRLASTHAQTAVLTVYRGDFRIARRAVDLRRGVTDVRLEADVGSAGPAVFVATCEAPIDTRRDNNGAEAVTMVRGRPRVLLVEAGEGEERWLRRALAAEQIDVVARPPAGVPEAWPQLNGFDLVILSDVPATRFRRGQMEALAAYVRHLGGGLIMIGGRNSFGPGGYYRTPIAPLLPVRLETPQREELPGIALVLAIDKSGSMNVDRKIELAKEAAKAAAEVLAPDDQVAVVTFAGASHVLLPLQPAREKARIAGTIARLRASGGTSIAPALREAHRILSQARAKLKHVILLSDGRSSPGDFETLTARMAADRITVSTVAIGAGADSDLLRQIAQWGGGRAYFTADPFNIPQIFTKETIRAARRAFVEEPFRPLVVRRAPVIRGLDFDAAPMLLSYCLTQPRPGAETILVSPPEVGGDPILARWRCGLGTVTAFTSDAKNRWAAEWLEAPIYGRFWTQVVRDAMRRTETADTRRWTLMVERRVQGFRPSVPPSLRPGVHRRSSAVSRFRFRARIVLDALDLNDEFVNDLDLSARVVGPRGEPRTVALKQAAPGRYEVEFDADRPGAYAVQISVQGSDGAVPGLACGFVQPGSQETRTLAADLELMRRIADVGRGRPLAIDDQPDLDDLFAAADDEAGRQADLWPSFVAAALIAFCLDVFLKRIRLPEARRRSRRAA